VTDEWGSREELRLGGVKINSSKSLPRKGEYCGGKLAHGRTGICLVNEHHPTLGLKRLGFMTKRQRRKKVSQGEPTRVAREPERLRFKRGEAR